MLRRQDSSQISEMNCQRVKEGGHIKSQDMSWTDISGNVVKARFFSVVYIWTFLKEDYHV